MINVTGGFLITDRMLKMFRKKEPALPASQTESHK
jgi:NAD/NADP transhydrogenase alpha subunit